MIQTNGVYEVDGEKNEEMVKMRRKNEKSLDPSMLRPTIINFVEQEEKKAKPNEKLLGSSEIIESVFGKLKRIEGDQEKSGFTGNLLSVCAMVSQTTLEMIKNAMETITTPFLNEWCMENLGDSIQCQRKKILQPCVKECVTPN